MSLYELYKTAKDEAVQAAAADATVAFDTVRPFLVKIGGKSAAELFDVLLLASADKDSGISKLNYSLSGEHDSPQGAYFNIEYATGNKMNLTIRELQGYDNDPAHNATLTSTTRYFTGSSETHTHGQFNTSSEQDWAKKAAALIFATGSEAIRHDLMIRNYAQRIAAL